MKKRVGNMRRGALVLFIIFGVIFLSVIGRFFYMQVVGDVNGVPLAAKAAQQHLRSSVIEANRGSILDQKGEVIAKDTASYTLAAVLDPKQSQGTKTPHHVVDKEKTAKVLAKYLSLKEADVLKKLKTKDLFQVEFGKAGKNLSAEVKDKIEAEKLPGLIFTKQAQRFYPNGVFASHLVGYAQQEEGKDGVTKLIGKMGIEKAYNSILTGKNGKINYDADKYGYILPNTKSAVEKAQDGSDIYLTLDKKIQTFLEDTLNTVDAKYNPKNMMAVVMNPKTGEILAMSQRDTFNPTTKEGLSKEWANLPVETTYEPGSVMKIFSLASAIDLGVYNPNAYYQSGTYNVGNIPIHDHNAGVGWGSITYREGVERSSNVAFAKLLAAMGPDKFKTYLQNFGFGQKTGIDLPDEASGKILYDHKIEQVTTVFGQGTTVSMMQMLQGATAIASDGKMKRPYVVSKIVNPNTGETVETKPTATGQPISATTAKQTREELRNVITGDVGTGKLYAIEGYDIAGKTGTSQIPNPKGGGYMTGNNNYIFSFMGMAPANDPELVMYVTMQQPQLSGSETGGKAVSEVFNPVMKNSLQYLNIKSADTAKLKTMTMDSVTGKTPAEAKKALTAKKLVPVVIGNGKKIVQQLPQPGEKILEGQRVILMTEGDMTIPDMRDWAKNDVLKVSEITGVPFDVTGNGYVLKQSASAGSVINDTSKITITLATPDKIPNFNKAPVADDSKKDSTDTSVEEATGLNALLN
ncbi:penicillin-binding protein [Listeria booriae]|uniref:Penicillin-binding protein n=1 Tax=Listeria booriae TaxID=1552123 RepID=A0A841XLG2_9LIST|nr:penicillin-binding transpeptidase domain-containing protein [Listeria booriae]MBC1306516.1 penicillin-binding protein [Listeria booriae]MBC1315608.1 penicillin-binding protein [Listeria booriae]